jgi:RND family efflux transporter MFP subunit
MYRIRTLPTVICLSLALAFVAASCGKKEEPPPREVIRPVKMMTVAGAGTEGQREYPGRIRASRRVDLAFQVSGPLIELPVDEGMQVKKGQVLGRILPRDFETNVNKARANALEAEQQFQRYRDLYIKKQVSKADFDKYKADSDIAKARLKEAEDALDDTYLRASFSGVVAKRYVENFEDVKAKEPIVSLQDISQVEVLIDLPESIFARVKGAAKPEVYATFATAPGKRYPLTVKEFSTQADPRTQAYQVTLLMPQPREINVLPGMTANVIGVTPLGESTGDRILIPAIAVVSDESGQAHVWVYDSETTTVSQQKVTVGGLTGTKDIEIVDGLNPGDTIAVTGVGQLREGMKVRPLEQP